MAKVEMICPFSGKLCKECSLYRGRHYLLCFNRNYRGYLNKNTEMNKQSLKTNFGFDVIDKEVLTNTKVFDPYHEAQNDIK